MAVETEKKDMVILAVDINQRRGQISLSFLTGNKDAATVGFSRAIFGD